MMICGSATDVPIDLCGSTFPPFTYTWKRCQNTSFPKKHLTSSLTVTSSPSTHTFSILTHWPTVQLEGKICRGQRSQLLSPPSYDTGVHPWVLLDSGSFQHCAALDTDPFINHNARSNCNIWTLEGYCQECQSFQKLNHLSRSWVQFWQLGRQWRFQQDMALLTTKGCSFGPKMWGRDTFLRQKESS